MSSPSDNQWPRYQVFHQPRPDKPHLNAGSVHAPDGELALQNARDVFVRRPDCSSLWVVRADYIGSLTREQYDAGRTAEPAGQSSSSRQPGSPEPSESPAASESPEPYLVFQKRSHTGAHEHTGEVQARSTAEALSLAAQQDAEQALVWWVVPKRLVAASEPDQIESLFGPARGKDYRGQAAYPTTTMMRKVRQQGGE